ncbi:MAG: alanine--tRNA ligase [Bdellovibrionia bacterium]
MKAAEIRARFLEYFSQKGHTIVESSSLVPQNDPTLLFANAGMNQFKDVFLGHEKRAYTRAASAQKCVRAGGKHNDLENVGFTARHHTFFEMLGNFSFGDYFKKEAIHYAWEFVTQVLKLPQDRLYVTVYEKDDEAAQIWHHQEGVPLDRIYRFGDKDNFWSMGETGPCGPCSELFIDRGEKYGCKKSTCAMGCDCDRYMEFWNLVFMQFNRAADGTLTPLPKPSVDTGAGLERLAAILQQVDTNYDADLFQAIIQKTAGLLGSPLSPQSEAAVSYRVIADHSRATAFLMGDGVLPSNEGRGYVLRRIMRRAIRHGKKLGFNQPFLYQTVGFVMEEMKDAYPDLMEKRAFIEKAVQAEEEQFFRTVERGLALLDEEVQKLGTSRTLSGEVAFKLYDTYGFPLDLTHVICAEQGIGVDEVGFERCMDRQRSESRKHWKGSGEQSINSVYLHLAQQLKSKGGLPQFVGYERLESHSPCLAILVPHEQGLESVSFYDAPALAMTADSTEGSSLIEAVFAETPFYGESGGQLGDRGRVLGEGNFEAEVIDVQNPVAGLIVAHLRIKSGTLHVGKKYTQQTDREIRALTACHHTATHMLHWALREVLGKHVKQAGSLVGPDLLRFDFSHFQAMSEGELQQVEDLVNEKIWASHPVQKMEMNKDEAIEAGAIAFFGEKYGDRVRVIRVGDFSTELCGGTHVNHAGELHLFKLVSESGIAAGVRRIVAYTSRPAFAYLRNKEMEVKTIRDRLKASSSAEILGKIDKLYASEKELKKQIETLQAKNASGEVQEILSRSHVEQGTQLVLAECAPNALGLKHLRELSDRMKQKYPNSVMTLGMKDPESGKVFLIVTTGPQAPQSLNSNEILQTIAPLIEGKGGGKPDFAQAGGVKAAGIPEALKKAQAWIENHLRASGSRSG